MSKSRKILGQWWLPSVPEEKWVGTLTLEQGKGPRLKVTVPKGFHQVPDCDPIAALYGHDQGGKPITLLFPGWPQKHGGSLVTTMRFSAGYALVGIEVPSADEFKVNEISLGLQHLYEWSGISGFKREEQNTLHNYTISYSRPADQKFTISSDLTLEVRAAQSFNFGGRERKASEDTCFGICSKSGLTLRELKDILVAARYLLHFAVLKPVYLLWMTAQKDGYGNTVNGEFYGHDIEIWDSIIRNRVESEFVDERWVFRFPDLQARFADFFASWLKLCRDYDEALGCYSTTIYHRLPDSVEHLCLTQALEAYHGLKYGQSTFATRIESLATQFLPHLSGLVQDARDFAEIVRDNRNYYTHHDPAIKARRRVLSGADLLRLNEKLKLIFQMCVLTEMGIPTDRFRRLRRQLAAWIIDYL